MKTRSFMVASSSEGTSSEEKRRTAGGEGWRSLRLTRTEDRELLLEMERNEPLFSVLVEQSTGHNQKLNNANLGGDDFGLPLLLMRPRGDGVDVSGFTSAADVVFVGVFEGCFDFGELPRGSRGCLRCC